MIIELKLRENFSVESLQMQVTLNALCAFWRVKIEELQLQQSKIMSTNMLGRISMFAQHVCSLGVSF